MRSHDAEEVRFEDVPPGVVAEVLERTADADARVVHEALEAFVADRHRELVDHPRDVVGVGDVEDHGTDVAGVVPVSRSPSGSPDAGVDRPAPGGEGPAHASPMPVEVPVINAVAITAGYDTCARPQTLLNVR